MITYTKEDIKVLVEMYPPSYWNHICMSSLQIDDVLGSLTKGKSSKLTVDEIHFLYNTEFEDIPPLLSNEHLGLLARWRLRIGK